MPILGFAFFAAAAAAAARFFSAFAPACAKALAALSIALAIAFEAFGPVVCIGGRSTPTPTPSRPDVSGRLSAVAAEGASPRMLFLGFGCCVVGAVGVVVVAGVSGMLCGPCAV